MLGYPLLEDPVLDHRILVLGKRQALLLLVSTQAGTSQGAWRVVFKDRQGRRGRRDSKGYPDCPDCRDKRDHKVSLDHKGQMDNLDNSGSPGNQDHRAHRDNLDRRDSRGRRGNRNILQFIPWIVLHPFAVLTGNLDYADYRNTLHWTTLNQTKIKSDVNTLAEAVEQLRRILPELIKVDAGISSSEWKIHDDFWHALNEEMRKGGFMWNLLSIHKNDDGSHTISDAHWYAIKQRIQDEELFSSGRPVVGDDPLALSNEVMGYVDLSVSKSFQDWLTKNADAVRKAQGEGKDAPNPYYEDLYGAAEKAVAARLKDLGLEERVVTRDEFISKIQDEIRKLDNDVKAEMSHLNDRLTQALAIATEANISAQLGPGLSRTEVEDLVAEIIRRTVADAQLEALAKGSIKSHHTHKLLKQKNYFSNIRGAIVNPKRTSDTFDWRIQTARTSSWFPFSSDKVNPLFRLGGKHKGVPFAPSIALEQWKEDGECWCAGHKGDTHSVDLSIFTAEPIIPRYLVVEHIDRISTFDPDSMPKDIEFWIQPPSDKTARTLAEWSKKKWADAKPSSGSGWKLGTTGFVKVAQFDFDSGGEKGDIHVFKLPDELVDFGIETPQVLIRANTNYGAEDHTCFYRLRLYGRKLDEKTNDGATQ
ncbi:hypothetical protein Daus18300_010681 [Diaporthe australafricana]|uniref:SUN domain-containing protein n=1 Tax=Diaporthe australafricana TaxID=127596 RepID=A0ABR3W9D6_9PEZI